MARIVERGEERYEAREVEDSKAYGWRSERVETLYECDADYATLVREEPDIWWSREEFTAHPWRSLHYFACAGPPPKERE